jgi:hypothetical protein
MHIIRPNKKIGVVAATQRPCFLAAKKFPKKIYLQKSPFSFFASFLTMKNDKIMLVEWLARLTYNPRRVNAWVRQSKKGQCVGSIPARAHTKICE